MQNKKIYEKILMVLTIGVFRGIIGVEVILMTGGKGAANGQQ